MSGNRMRQEKRKIRGISLFLIPRIIQEQVVKKRGKLSRIHIVRERYNRFTIAIVWRPGDRKFVPDGFLVPEDLPSGWEAGSDE